MEGLGLQSKESSIEGTDVFRPANFEKSFGGLMI
jgi:hypothetical protein